MTKGLDLVLLHGALGSSRQLEPLAEALRPHFRVHRLDFEGHASAAPRDRPFRIHYFAEDVIEYCDRASVTSASFFGHSMGGYVALRLATERPALVERVATLGTKFRWDSTTADREASRLDPDKIRAKVPQFADALAERHGPVGGWVQVLASTAEFLRDLGAHPVLTDETLARVHQPVRVIVGQRDNTVSVDESSSVARILGNGSVAVLPDAPHAIEQVDATTLAAELREFYLRP